MKTILSVVTVFFLLVSSQAFARSGNTVVVSGSVSFPAEFLLPKDAVLSVIVEDVSMADAPSVLLAETRLPLKEAVTSVPFKIEIPRSFIDSRFSYSVRATVKADDQLLLSSTQAYRVLTRDAPNKVNVNLEIMKRTQQTKVQESFVPHAGLHGRYWKLIELEGEKVKFSPTQRREVHLIFEENMARFKGFGGCNRLSGSYQNSDVKLKMQQIVTTKMMCSDSEMVLEEKFKMALLKVLDYRVDGQFLIMLDGQNILARYEVVYF